MNFFVKEEHILDTPAKIKNQLKKAWDKYQELGNKSESANRMALYQQLIQMDLLKNQFEQMLR